MTIKEHMERFENHPHAPVYRLRYEALVKIGYSSGDEIPEHLWNLETPIHNFKEYQKWLVKKRADYARAVLDRYYTQPIHNGLTYYQLLVSSYAQGGKDINLFHVEEQLKEMADTEGRFLFNLENEI